jgi:RHS repeat-associated protein
MLVFLAASTPAGVGRLAASPAGAVTLPPRVCSGQSFGGTIAADEHHPYVMRIPSGANVSVSGVITVTSRDTTGGWQALVNLDPVRSWLAGTYYGAPGSWPESGTYHNGGPTGDVVFDLWGQYGRNVGYQFTFTIDSGPTGPACGGPDVSETAGANPSEPHARDTQSDAGDPVNTLTGNFNVMLPDVAVAGRGPGLAAARSYNSSQAAVDGPFGFGWAWTYGPTLAYDPVAGTATITQESGAHVTFTANGSGDWDAESRVVATLAHNGDGTWTLVRGSTDTLTFDPAGRLTSVADLNGETTTVSYDGAGHATTVANSSGRSLSIGWTGSHITSITDGSTPARTVSYGYNSAGELVSVTDVGGGSFAFGYDAGHRLVTLRDPNQASASPAAVMANTYDSAGRVVAQANRAGKTTVFDYTSIPGATKVTDPDGHVTVDYYQNGLRIQTIRGYGTTSAATWQFEYDPVSLGVTKVTDPEGHVTTAVYDGSGNVLSTTDALGHVTTATYNGFNQPLTTTVGSGSEQVTTTYTYDSRGNPTAISTPLNGSTPATSRTVGFAYSNSAHPGELSTVTDPRGKISTYTYNTAGDRVAVVDPTGDKTTWTTNAVGWVTATVSPRGNTTGANPADYTTSVTYNPYGDPLSTTDPLGHTTSRTYDANRNVTSVTDPAGNVTTTVHDAEDRVTQVNRPGGTSLTTTYTDGGAIKTQADGANGTTTYTYDPLGRVATTTDPVGAITADGYDRAGNLTTVTDPANRTTTRTFNAANQLTAVTYSDGVTPNVTAVAYDSAGRRTSVTQANGINSTWSYDSLGRLTASSDGTSGAVSYGYDLAGNPTSTTYPGSHTVTRGYDDAGRLITSTDWLGNTTTFAYNPDSQPTATDFPGTQADTYSYDRAGSSNTITMGNGASTLASLAYTRDNRSAITGVTQTGLPGPATQTYGYNTLGQLTTTNGATTWEYDPADNLTRTNTTPTQNSLQGFNADNQLCWQAATSGTCAAPPSNGTTFSYDPAGNRTTARTGASDTPHLLLGNVGDKPIVGDWNNDGTTTIGVYRDGIFHFYLKNTNGSGASDVDFQFGQAGDIPVAGDWDGNGTTTIGVYRPSNSTFYLKNSLSAGAADKEVHFGNVGDTPIVGNWDGSPTNKTTTVGVVRGITWYTTNADISGCTVCYPAAEPTHPTWGNGPGGGDQPVVGDWDGNGTTTFGIDRNGTWIESNNNTTPNADIVQTGLDPSGTTGVAGDWDGPVGNDVKAHPGAWYPNGAYYVLHGDSKIQTNAYDQANRLCWTATVDSTVPLSCNTPPPSPTTYGNTTTYTYNPDGLRTTKTTAGTTTSFAWDHTTSTPQLISETTGANTSYYLYGPDGLPYAQITQTGTVTYLHHDQLGSTRLATNPAGAVTGAATYDPYGQPTATTGTLPNLGYAGQYTDPETGYQYLRARYYDPATGQLLTKDPITALTGTPYSYAGNNPLNNTDPTGQFCLGPLCTSNIGPTLALAGGIAGGIACGTTIICGVAVGAGTFALAYTARYAGTNQWNWTDLATTTIVGAATGGLGAGAARIGATTAEAGADVLATPEVENTKLQNVVNDLYKGTTNAERVGTGTTADAVRNEIETGEATGGKFHFAKAEQYSTALSNLIKGGTLSPHDQVVAQSLFDDLQNALGNSP